MWQRSQKGSSIEAAKELEHEAADSVKAVAHAAEGAVEKAEKKVVEKST